MDRAIPAASAIPAQHQELEELRLENQSLRTKLENLLDLAHRNQNIMARHQSFDLKIIGANSFRELIAHIFSALSISSDLDMVTLLLLDQRADLQRRLGDLKIDVRDFPHLTFIKHESELQKPPQPFCDPEQKPLLGKFHPEFHRALFASCAIKPSSVAIIPLWRQGRLIGCLNLGSFQADRFQTSMATDFIQRLGSIIAICLENVINNEKLNYIGLTDPLTNVSNRRYVEQRTLEEITRAQRQKYSLACMYLDIDFFKKINDQYGHQGGDDVLREVAKRIKAELRLSDTLGRFGGEEFVVLLVNTDLQNARLVAERIRKSIADFPFLLGESGICKTSVSIGLSTVAPGNSSGDVTMIARDMLIRADQALYRAKKTGRNQVCYN